LSGNKIAVLLRSPEGTNYFIIQAEISGDRAKKRPLNFGDMMLFKSTTHLLWMSIQKFIILATSQTITSGLKPTLDFIANTVKQNTLKKLNRFLQENIKA
jgi:hypothetical protein